MNFRNLEEFWSMYMSQHSKRSTRRWHFIGTWSAIVCVFLSILLASWWLLLLAPILGYGFAWYSHLFVERNNPTTFTHPVWSFLCDLRMFGLMLTGRMEGEIKRLGKRPILQPY